MSAILEEGRARQRRAADPGLSAWVAANAGAGKTTVLVERVIRLLLAGTRAERILCLTFTKAAAAEMEGRLFGQLGKWAVAPDADLVQDLGALDGTPPDAARMARARRLFAQAVETPGGLKIETIHAFAQAVLRRFPHEAGIAPHFAVMDERAAREALAEARDRVLLAAGADPVAAARLDLLAPFVDDGGFANLLAALAARRGILNRLLRRHGGPEGVVAALRDHLGLDPGQSVPTLTRVLVGAPPDLARVPAALDHGSDGDRGRSAKLRAFLSQPLAERDADAYRAFFLTKDDVPKADQSLITKAAREADPRAADILFDERARVHALNEAIKAARVVEATGAALGLSVGMLAAFDADKRRRALLDYEDLIDKTLALLSEADAAPWVLFKLDGGLDHVLVDEAQDTSPGQWAIVRALTDEIAAGEGANRAPRTIFAVGDEKQSIYSFQGADPSGFERMRRHYAASLAAAGHPFDGDLTLALSFRSAPEILTLVDRVFAGAEGEGLTADGRPVRHVAARRDAPGRVELWEPVTPDEAPDSRPWSAPLDQQPARSPRRVLAERIAAKIAGWLSPTGEMLTPRGRRVQPGDVLILVRRRDVFVDEVIRALKQAGVPVAGADRMRLSEQIAVMDLLALARFCLLAEDDLTLACLLKSPLVGVSETALFDLAQARAGDLWSALRAARDPTLMAARARLDHWRALADRLAPHDLFARVLDEGGRARLLERLGAEANDPIDELLAQALAYERLGTPSLQGFVHWLDRAEVEIKRDLDQGRDQVRVMTVHGAKGLEAPIVFLPDTCAVPTGAKGPILVPLGARDETGTPEVLAYAPRANLVTGALEEARLSQRLDEANEHRRLLYVALTRAKDWLYVGGYEGKLGRAAGCWYDLVAPALRDLGAETTDETGATVWRLAGSAEPLRAEPAAPPPRAEPPPDWLTRPAPAEPRAARPLAPSRLAGEDQAWRSPVGARDGGRFQRGRLIHRLLQTLPDLPVEARAAAATRFLSQSGLGLDATARDAIREETLAVLSDPVFAPIFGPGSRAEVALTGRLPDLDGDGAPVLIAGQIDRLVVLPDAILIIDFKTNRPPPAEVADVAPLYLRQMAAYRAALGQIHPWRPVRAALLWTDGPRLMELPGALLDAVAGRLTSP